jgi:hypothetical protein
MSTRERFQQIADYFETLTPQSVSALKDFYSASARFKDPCHLSNPDLSSRVK